MSSISTSKQGVRRILFKLGYQRRKSLHLGKVTVAVAKEIQHHVDEIIQAESMTRPMDRATVFFISKMPTELHRRMAALGLVTARAMASDMTLKGYCESFIKRRAGDWKPATRFKHEQCLAQLIGQFPATMDVASFTEADAKDFRRAQAVKFKEATVATRVACARRFFGDAVDRRIIDRNPFAKVRVGSFESKGTRYVPADVVEQVIDVADPTWAAIITLCRYGGLRVPSELVGLRWEDIDWQGKRLTIHSPKTERQGKASRIMPLFDEIADRLKVLPRDGEFVFTRRVTAVSNLRTGMLRLIDRAGVAPWPRLFHNLRASRIVDLVQAGRPLFRVCQWLGNTEKIAKKHYTPHREGEFAEAVEAMRAPESAQRAAKIAETAPEMAGSHIPALTNRNESPDQSVGRFCFGTRPIEVILKRAWAS